MRTHIFCTNINSQAQLDLLSPHLNNHNNIIRWSVDLEDIDAVLKVITTNDLKEHDIIHLLDTEGYQCKIMAD